MANIFDQYKNAEDEVATPTIESISKAKSPRMFKKKHIKKHNKLLEAIAEALTKHNELMEQEAARRKAEEEAAERAAAKKANKGQSDDGMKGFLHKLGNAICKAVPRVLTTLTTLIFGHFVKMKLTGKAPQAA